MTFDFELGGFGIEIKNENDYLELVDILEGLQKRAGIKYTIEDFYEDYRGRRHPFTIYDSFKCKIIISDPKKFENYCRVIEGKYNAIYETERNKKRISKVRTNENACK